MKSLQTSNNASLVDRLVSVATYLTAGGIGFVWLIIITLAKKRTSSFLTYHIMQSIFLSILYFIIQIFCQLIFVILYRIPLINKIPYLINMPIQSAYGFSIIQLFTTTILIYLVVTAFLGMYSYIPWVSNIIGINSRR